MSNLVKFENVESRILEIRELSRNIKVLSDVKDKSEQQGLMQKSGETITEILDDDLKPQIMKRPL